MANIVRQEMGLDAAQAAGGWKSRDVVEKTYTDAPNELNRKVVDHVEGLVSGLTLNKILKELWPCRISFDLNNSENW